MAARGYRYRKLIQMRTDGVGEERIEEEMAKMGRAEQEAASEFMLPNERARMRERSEALQRDRQARIAPPLVVGGRWEGAYE